MVWDYPGYTPLHVAAYVGSLEMVKAITSYYKNNQQLVSKPWLVKDAKGSTPLHIALQNDKNEDCAMEILSLDLESLCDFVNNSSSSPLFLAVTKGYNDVAKKFMDHAPKYIASGEGFLTALHFAPNCSVEVCRLLIKKEAESQQQTTHKTPILHKWIELKKASQLYMDLYDEDDDKITEYLFNLISKCDRNDSNAFHCFVRDQNMKDSKIIADFYQKHGKHNKDLPPWLKQNRSRETPFHMALKQVDKKAFEWLRDTYGDTTFKPDEVGPLVRAIKRREYDVATQIGETLAQYGWRPFCAKGKKIWQLQGNDRTDVKVAEWLVSNLANFIPEEEAGEALNYASKHGYDWLVRSVLKEHPSSLDKVPSVWKKACKKGYYKTVVAFIENCPYFREVCLKEHTTPLHYVKFIGYEEYRLLLENPVMKGLRNYQDRKGNSPLHHAIEKENIQLTEVLLSMDDVSRTLENESKNTPMHLLHGLFKDKEVKTSQLGKWETMCIRNGITPGLNIKYFRDKPNVHEVRNTLSVVAALLATITFTAGFTVPGGFDQEEGDAILGHNAAFIAFILFDAFAMFCSFLMLVSLMWSMICDHAKSLILIDRSVYILLAALVCTVAAFITGVYVVLHKKCLWVAIFIVVSCSLFVLAIYKPIVDLLLNHWSPKHIERDIEQGGGTDDGQEDHRTTTTGQEDNSSWCKKLFRCFRIGQPQRKTD